MSIHKRGLFKYFWFLKFGTSKIFDVPNWFQDQHRRMELVIQPPSTLSVTIEITGKVAISGLKILTFWLNPKLDARFEEIEAELEPMTSEISSKPDTIFPIRLKRGLLRFRQELPQESDLLIRMKINGSLAPGSLGGNLPWGITSEAALLKDELMWIPFIGKSALNQFVTNSFTFEMNLDLPGEWLAAATGIPEPKTSTGSLTFKSDDFTMNGISVIAGCFEDQWEVFTDDVFTYWLRLPPLDTSAIKVSKNEIIETILQVGSELAAIWGKPRPRDVVICFTRTGFGGFCSGNFITLDESAGKTRETLFGNLAHEMTHLWWPGTFVIKDVKMLWTGEGFPEFMTYYLERECGLGDKDLNYWKKYFKPKPLRKLRPLLDFRDNMLTRANPVIVLHRLEQEMGRESFRNFLNGLGTHFHSHPVTWEQFVLAFQKYGNVQQPLQVLQHCGF